MADDSKTDSPAPLVGADGLPSLVHITPRSHYSIGLGAATVEEIIVRAKAGGATAVGLMDDATMAGALEFATKARSKGLKPLVGMRLPLALPSGDAPVVGLVVLNKKGWENLCGITTVIHGKRRGQLPIHELQNYAEGLALLTGEGEKGILSDALLKMAGKREREDETQDNLQRRHEQMLDWISRVFPGRVYIEMCRPQDAELDRALIACADDAGLPLLATMETRYASPYMPVVTGKGNPVRDGHLAWQIFDALTHGKLVSDSVVSQAPLESEKRHMRDMEEMSRIFADLPEAIAETGRLAVRANYAPAEAKPSLPVWREKGAVASEDPMKDRAISDANLREQTLAGLSKILAKLDLSEEKKEVYKTRLDYELGVISNMGFSDYFLIVSDFIAYAYREDIPVGPGRGSGAGSLVAYTLGITRLDPITHGLLFERFLNPERVSMPDFDLDFCAEMRQRIFDYIQERHPPENVAPIISFGEARARSALDKVAMVLIGENGKPYPRAAMAEVKSLLPTDKALAVKPLRDQVAATPELAGRIRGDVMLSRLFRAAVSIEGLYTQEGIHASGLIIAAQPIASTMPLREAKPEKRHKDDPQPEKDEARLVCAWDMKFAEMGGAVKFDILGLTCLTTMHRAEKSIRRYLPGFSVDDIAFDDPGTMERFCRGDTLGSFQFESAGMRDSLRDVRPARFSDVAVVNALYRPGPMQFIASYAARKRGDEIFEYPGIPEKTKVFLEETFGFMVYQEQVMVMAQVMAGYSLAGADLLRRAMGKKIKAEMDAQKDIFINGDEKTNVPGAVKNGMSPEAAEKLFALIERFAEYGFNKPHAVAYALLGYRTLWLRHNHMAAYAASLLTDELKKRKTGLLKFVDIKRDCLAHGIGFLPPDINRSDYEFTTEVKDRAYDDQDGHRPDSVRVGFAIISKLTALRDAFVAARNERHFTSIADFAARVPEKVFNKSQIENLIFAGSFDSLEPNRAQVVTELKWRWKNSNTSNDGVVLELPPDKRNTKTWPPYFATENEFKACGTYITSHPIDLCYPILQRAGVREIEKLQGWLATPNPDRSVKKLHPEEPIQLVAMVDNINERKTKDTGSPFLSVWFSSREASFQAQVFPPRYDPNAQKILDNVLDVLEEARNARSPVVISCKCDSQAKRVTVLSVASADEMSNAISACDDVLIHVPEISDADERERALTFIRTQLRREIAETGEPSGQPIIRMHSGNSFVEERLDFRVKPYSYDSDGIDKVKAVYQVELIAVDPPKGWVGVSRPARVNAVYEEGYGPEAHVAAEFAIPVGATESMPGQRRRRGSVSLVALAEEAPPPSFEPAPASSESAPGSEPELVEPMAQPAPEPLAAEPVLQVTPDAEEAEPAASPVVSQDKPHAPVTSFSRSGMFGRLRKHTGGTHTDSQPAEDFQQPMPAPSEDVARPEAEPVPVVAGPRPIRRSSVMGMTG